MTTDKLKIPYLILVLGYLILPLAIPNLSALDSAGPRFLALAVLNLLSLGILLLDFRFDRKKVLDHFWTNPIGIAYLLFIVFSVFSFVGSINLNESLVIFTRIFTVFVSSYFLFKLFSRNKNYILVVAVGLSVFLLVDCFALLYGVFQYISGNIEAISDIVFIYSNKNILASAIFVKLSAALWLIFFFKSWQRVLGYVAVFLATFSIFLLSSRSFYLGLGVMVFALSMFILIKFVLTKKAIYVKPLISFIAISALSLGLFTVTQKYLYPKEADVLNKDIATRISTIGDVNANAKRLDYWGYSIDLIKENPILGVGTGNWKLQVLQYANKTLPDYKYMSKNHNDFLEHTAETGILGGFAFLAIFIFIVWGFLKLCFRRNPDPQKLRNLAFPAIGILAYSVDAFFNFPSSRVSMQILFAIFVGIGIATSELSLNKAEKFKIPRLVPILLLIVLTFGSLYILNETLKSLRIQRLVKEDAIVNKFSPRTARQIAKYPKIPNINCVGGPIFIDEVRYSIDEGDFERAKELIQSDKSSPYDYRKEYYLGMILAEEGDIDSAVVVLGEFVRHKPLFQFGIDLYGTVLYNGSRAAYTQQDYEKTLELTAKLISIRPDYVQINPIRAYCMFYTHQYEACLKLIDQIIADDLATDDILALKTQCEDFVSNQNN